MFHGRPSARIGVRQRSWEQVGRCIQGMLEGVEMLAPGGSPGHRCNDNSMAASHREHPCEEGWGVRLTPPLDRDIGCVPDGHWRQRSGRMSRSRTQPSKPDLCPQGAAACQLPPRDPGAASTGPRVMSAFKDPHSMSDPSMCGRTAPGWRRQVWRITAAHPCTFPLARSSTSSGTSRAGPPRVAWPPCRRRPAACPCGAAGLPFGAVNRTGPRC